MHSKDILFNDSWQFCLCDIGTELSALVSKKWYDVELPHDWLIGDTANLYKTGEGWYRRTLSVSAEQLSGRVLLNFDGVYMNSTVFVNGKEVGTWTYGYSAFEYDITDFLSEGDNEILVRVKYESPNSRWYSGAGIFRDVTLKLRDNTYIRTNGVYIHSEKGEGDTWHTEIETDICGEAADITMVFQVLSPDYNVIAGFKQQAKFGGGTECFSNSFDITAPAVWDVTSPEVYMLEVELYKNDELIEVQYITYGYRTVEFSPEKGFVLNGKQLKLHGVCMHHDLGALGAAVNDTALYRQLRIMKEMGCNAVRTTHNMPARQLVEMCRDMGLMVVSEAFDMWENSKTEFDNHRFFKEHAERDVRSWIERDRNSPSMIMWSIGNEISDTNDPHGIEITQRLYDYVEKYDPKHNARATIGSNFMGSENAQKCSDIVKLAGYNYTERLYNDHHAKYPDWMIYGSETASAVRSRGIYHFPADTPILTHEDLQCSSLDNSVVGWGSSAMKSWRLDRDHDFCGGQFVWTGFDYIGEPTPYSTKNSYFGIVDTAGFPKDAYYFYKSVWTDEPMIHIVPSYWDFNDGDMTDVIIYSNAHTVELFLNGESLGKHEMKLLTDERMRAEFRVAYKAGELTAKGYDESGEVIAEETLRSNGDPAQIVLKEDGEGTCFANGTDICFVEISVTDKDGNPVGNARNRIRVEVSGAGRLVGLDNGDSTDYDSYKGDNRRLFSGKLLAMVRSTTQAGDIIIKAASEGLASAELVIPSHCAYDEDISGVSAAAENSFPAVKTEYTDEVPVRKIVPLCDTRELDADRKTAEIRVKLLPENATYSDITWKCVRNTGVEVNNATVQWDGEKATVTALGDGEFIARAFVNNGASQPQVCADVVFSVAGLGAATRDAYSFISASQLDSSNVTVNLVEDGAIGSFDGRTVMSYNNVDLGRTGAEEIIIHIGTCFDMPVEVWDGIPGEEGAELISRITYHDNKHWCGFVPERFALPARLRGLHTISIVIDSRVTFGGFEFAAIDRAFDTNYTAESDSIYGDDYRIDGRSVVGIGNNVIINYEGLDFGENGTSAVTIRGITANPSNQVQLRYTPEGGEQTSVLLEFMHSEELSEQRFDIPRLTGRNDISFVFLPGTKFDFEWFRFE
ncbi:MAG: DUF4982 domain-containing protein [Oscillospiraceae bacterium]|nr:DUF4982 domain-containing protein [Oscillospiraceae bacterium]